MRSTPNRRCLFPSLERPCESFRGTVIRRCGHERTKARMWFVMPVGSVQVHPVVGLEESSFFARVHYAEDEPQ